MARPDERSDARHDDRFIGRPDALRARRYVAIGGQGPEDVVADARGRVLTGVEDGRILRLDGLLDPEAVQVETLADTGGRPLGLELLPDDGLLVCDAERGLLRVDLGNGAVRVLADSVAGSRCGSAATWSPCPTAACTSPCPAAATPRPVAR